MLRKVYILTRDGHILDQKLAARKKKPSSGSSTQRSGTSTTAGNEDEVMNQHTTVVQADVRDVVHAIDGGLSISSGEKCGQMDEFWSNSSWRTKEKQPPSKGLYCDPHEATKVQDTSQPTITRGLEARVLRLDGLLMNPPTTSKQTFAPWKSPGKTFVNKNQNSSLKKT
ncbi:hypothetical protein ACFX2F_030299 [Malus domestica]